MIYQILGMRVDPTSYKEATQKIIGWAHNAESRYVCVANVHMVMEAYDAPDFREVVNQSDLVTPDGVPLVWALRKMGCADQQRVYGPELTLRVAEAASKNNIPVGFYGGAPQTLELLVKNLQIKYSDLRVVYQYSPPFHPLTEEEDQRIVEAINTSGARLLFVGLGCPKQERWMGEHHRKLQAVLLGVGAAFDFAAGLKRQAPAWMQRNGLEWLFRLVQEPQRLWRRYLIQNPRFVVLFMLQLLHNPKNRLR